MKVILVGATGTLGKAVDRALSPRHEIVRVGRKGGDFQIDIAIRSRSSGSTPRRARLTRW